MCDGDVGGVIQSERKKGDGSEIVEGRERKKMK